MSNVDGDAACYLVGWTLGGMTVRVSSLTTAVGMQCTGVTPCTGVQLLLIASPLCYFVRPLYCCVCRTAVLLT